MWKYSATSTETIMARKCQVKIQLTDISCVFGPAREISDTNTNIHWQKLQ